ncbi:hypothetical protein HZH68_001797 [Vespula germanica]|uniref:Uncharacterized protein n=1 Tax=Vespula germanica TaxID=30212 RepID=A0A834NWB6_VESGE|nr:hypothetical protein HZH68_001797 [Vespula germanica]
MLVSEETRFVNVGKSMTSELFVYPGHGQRKSRRRLNVFHNVVSARFRKPVLQIRRLSFVLKKTTISEENGESEKEEILFKGPYGPLSSGILLPTPKISLVAGRTSRVGYHEFLRQQRKFSTSNNTGLDFVQREAESKDAKADPPDRSPFLSGKIHSRTAAGVFRGSGPEVVPFIPFPKESFEAEKDEYRRNEFPRSEGAKHE